MQKVLILGLFSGISILSNAQEVNLLIQWTDTESPFEASQAVFKSEKAAFAHINDVLGQVKLKGHIGASIDSIVRSDDRLQAFLYAGPLWVIIEKDSLGLTDSGVQGLEKKVLKERVAAENSGYPFTRQGFLTDVKKDTITYSRIGIKGTRIELDSIVQLGDVVVDQGVLAAHLRLKKGDFYREDRLQKVDLRLKQLPFVRVVRPTEVIFTEDRYRLLLALEKKKANSANGILGFQPDEDGKVRTTGEVDLLLQNALKRADRISLNWRRLQDASQKLEVAFAYPYLFRSPIGIAASLDQFRQDSTFNQIESEIGLSLLLDNGDIIKVDMGKRSFLNLLESSSADIVDSRSTIYGADYTHNSLDDLFNPYRGFKGVWRIAYGNKQLSSISDEDLPVEQTFASWEVSADIKKFLPLATRSTLMLRVNAFHQQSDVIIYKELQRIGGLSTLRGMDELSIRASTYGVMTAEFRYLTDERAYISSFIDLAYYEANLEESFVKDTPYGIGIGTAFDTGAGIFALNYALGSRFDSPLSFRTGKIHFGYRALF